MSYTLTVEPDVVRTAETFATRRGTSLDAILRAYIVAFVRNEMAVSDQRIPSDSVVSSWSGLIKPTNLSDKDMIASAILEKYGSLV